MAVVAADVRSIAERICARPEVLDACRQRDLSVLIEAFGAHGVTQGQLAGLTGIPQGRLSEYRTRKRVPMKASVFEDFADGACLPAAARQALGLAGGPPAPGGQPAAQLPDVGVVYPGLLADAVEHLAVLWHADLADVTAISQGHAVPGAWGDAALRWLVDASSQPENEQAGRIRVGQPDVERFRTTAEMFSMLDDMYGGGHARQALIQYLATDGERLLRGRYSETVGRQLLSAASQAALLAAWMSYDSAPGSALAQRYFIQALALSQAADDRLLGASILDAMSHQATHIGRYTEAATLARAARAGAGQRATATLVSHFHAMEARALARLGDARGCDRALAEAAREFGRRQPASDPHWIGYFNESELSAEFAHCMRDLGRPADAARLAAQILPAGDDAAFMRSDFFVAMVLADAQLAAGDMDAACKTALKAFSAGEQIRSARCINYVREFRQHLTHAGSNQYVVAFSDQAGSSRLWRIASRPDKPLPS
jgi:hypothetical protein